MAAYFYTYSGGDVFGHIAGDGSSLISIDTLQSLVDDKGSLAIISDISIQTAEINQLFPTFDDVIHYIHFGKGVGSITVNGMLFSDCDNQIPGLSEFYSAFAAMRGKKTAVSMGGVSFYALVTNSSCTLMSEPDTMAQFQVSMSIIQDSLGGST